MYNAALTILTFASIRYFANGIWYMTFNNMIRQYSMSLSSNWLDVEYCSSVISSETLPYHLLVANTLFKNQKSWNMKFFTLEQMLKYETLPCSFNTTLLYLEQPAPVVL